MNRQYAIADFLEIKSAFSPHWNNDGSRIAFLNNTTGVNQLYMVSRAGGETAQLTSFEDGIESISYCPTRDEILIGKSSGGDENTQLMLLDVKTGNVRLLTDAPNVQHRFGGWSRDGKYIAYTSNERNMTDFDVFVYEMESGKTTCVYDEGGSCRSVGFSPTGNILLVRKSITTESDDLIVLDLKAGTTAHLAKEEEKPVIGAVCWLPDDKGFFFTTDKDRDFIGLAYYDFVEKTEQYVFTPEWDVSGALISKDGKNIFVWVNENGYSKTTIFNTADMQPLANQHFPKGDISSCAWSHDGKSLALILGGSRKNSSMFVWSKDEDRFWQVVEMPQGVPEEVLVEPELVHYQSFDKRTIPAFLFLPKQDNVSDTHTYPVLVYIHGGPVSQFCPVFNPLIQYLVYSGYAVIAPNIRGSSGYGKNYIALDDVRKRADTFKDLAFLHSYVKSQKILDAEKVFLWGGSYGGYMVLAGLTFSPELWAGGVDIVGFSNLVTFLEHTSSYRRALREAEYGSLKDDRDFMESISPSNFVENIRAPLFIIHGENDPRVPVSEARQMYQKMKDHGQSVDMVIYPDEGHGILKLSNRIDAYSKAVDFLNSVSGNSDSPQGSPV